MPLACGAPLPSQPGIIDDPLASAVVDAWVGRYTGVLQGAWADGPTVDEQVTLRITRDHSRDCPNCVAVELGPYFNRSDLPLRSPGIASFSYSTDTTRHTLVMDRQDNSGSLLGRIQIEAGSPATGWEPAFGGDFELTKR